MDAYFDLKTNNINQYQPKLKHVTHTRYKRRPRHEKVKVGNRQEMAQSLRNFHSKTGVLRLLSFSLFCILFSIFAFVVLFAFETLV